MSDFKISISLTFTFSTSPALLDFFSSICFSTFCGGGRVVRWSWINFQCRGVLLVWIRVGQGPTALAVGAGGGCLDIFTLFYPFSPLSPSLWETTRYRLKYCLKGSLSPKSTNQPIHILSFFFYYIPCHCRFIRNRICIINRLRLHLS